MYWASPPTTPMPTGLPAVSAIRPSNSARVLILIRGSRRLKDNHGRARAVARRFYLLDTGVRQRPAEDPLGIFGPHVDTSMAARAAIVIVPVGAMDGNAPPMKIADPRHTRQIKEIGRGGVIAGHVAGWPLAQYRPVAGGRAKNALAVLGAKIRPGGYKRLSDHLAALISA